MRKRILVVDDDADVAEPLAILLSRSYDVDLAANGAEAIDRVGRTHYDAVVLDLMMPVMDGAAFKAWLDLQPLELPVLLVSGSDELAERARELRVAGHLAKPLDPTVLRDRLAAILGQTAKSSTGDARPAPPLAAQGGAGR